MKHGLDTGRVGRERGRGGTLPLGYGAFVVPRAPQGAKMGGVGAGREVEAAFFSRPRLHATVGAGNGPIFWGAGKFWGLFLFSLPHPGGKMWGRGAGSPPWVAALARIYVSGCVDEGVGITCGYALRARAIGGTGVIAGQSVPIRLCARLT